MKGMIGFVTLFTSGSQIIASKLGGPPVEFAAKLAAPCELMIKGLNSFHFNGQLHFDGSCYAVVAPLMVLGFNNLEFKHRCFSLYILHTIIGPIRSPLSCDDNISYYGTW